MPHLVASFISVTLGALLGALVASGLGAASTVFYVAGLLPIGLGLAAGIGASIGHLITGRAPGRAAVACSIIGIAVGWLCFQAWDDHHFQRAWAEDLANARQATTGMPGDAGFDEESVSFFAPDAPERLEEQVRGATGYGGVAGRWWLRAQSGVRLIGPWQSSRGLNVGVAGAILWALLELAAAGWVSREVMRRVARSPSVREAEHLDDHPGQDESAT